LALPLTTLDETKEDYFVSSDCPVTTGAEEIEVYFDVKKDRLFFFCRWCGITSLRNPDTSDADYYSLDEITSDDVRLPTIEELLTHGIQNPRIIYEEIDAEIRAKMKSK